MFDDFIKWLEDNHLNHAGIVLLGMYPMSLITSTPWDAAIVWSFGYYIREVTQAGRLGGFRPLMPWLWGFHDRVQTIYAVMTAFISAYILIRLLETS